MTLASQFVTQPSTQANVLFASLAHAVAPTQSNREALVSAYQGAGRPTESLSSFFANRGEEQVVAPVAANTSAPRMGSR